jgi:hypothetical protein
MIPPVIERPFKFPDTPENKLRKEEERIKQEHPELSFEEIWGLVVENLCE